MLAEPSSSHRGSAGQERRLGDVELVLDLADQLLQNILDGHQSGGGTEFIHHHRQMPFARLELGQQIGQRLGLGNHQHLAHDVPNLQPTGPGDRADPDAVRFTR